MVKIFKVNGKIFSYFVYIDKQTDIKTSPFFILSPSLKYQLIIFPSFITTDNLGKVRSFAIFTTS